MALGGVPTGIWNAIQQDRAAGNIRYNGCISIATDISASTGNMMFAMATFDVNSVKVCAAKHTRNNNNNGGRSFRPTNEFPNIADMPDRLPPSANAKPPPNKKIKLHGTLALIYFHVISPCDGAVGSLAAKNQLKLQSLQNRLEILTRFAAEEVQASPIRWDHEQGNDDENSWSTVLDFCLC